MEAVKWRIRVNRATEKGYNVPKTTLKDRLAGRVKHGSKSGPEPYLMSSEGNELVSFKISASKMSHGKTKREVIHRCCEENC